MRQDIKGFNDHHPHKEALSEYAMDAPEGKWIGRLDDLAWGKSHNLFCFFTDTAMGKKYRLSTFSQKKYAPAKEGPVFDEEPRGGTFEITTGKSKTGLPTFLTAQKLS